MQLAKKEIWEKIEGFDYEVSNLGRIRRRNACDNRNRHDLVKVRRNQRTGYVYVWLYKDGTKYKLLLHRLLLKAFVSEPDTDLVAVHLNEDSSDNSLNNLAWWSRRQIALRSHAAGRSKSNFPKGYVNQYAHRKAKHPLTNYRPSTILPCDAKRVYSQPQER